MQAASDRARKQAEDARRQAANQKKQLEADLRAANRKPASGRASENWRRQSERALDVHADPVPSKPRSATASLQGGKPESSTSNSDNAFLESRAGDSLASSYQKRLAEIRANSSRR